MVRFGPKKGIWAVAADHRDGKKRTPFIYAGSAARAMDKLRERHERHLRKKLKQRRDPMPRRRLP